MHGPAWRLALLCVASAALKPVWGFAPCTSLVRPARAPAWPRPTTPATRPHAETKGGSGGLGGLLREMIDDVNEQMSSTETICEMPILFGGESDGLGSRSQFDFRRWEEHRSGSRYGKLLVGLFFGVTTRRISPVVLLLTLFSVIVCLYDNMAANMIGIPELQLPLTPFELTAPVLGLLLVFRTNAGYDRFTLGSDVSWEITSRLRDMSRLVAAWCDENDAKQASIAGEIMDELVLYHSWLMATYLREGGGTGSGIQEGEGGGTKREMGVEDAEAGDALRDIIRTQSQYLSPSVVMLDLSKKINTLDIDVNLRCLLESHLMNVQVLLGQCEKLIRTPIPLGYTRYTVRFLWLWLTLLPFALVRTFDEFGANTWWQEVPQPITVVAIAFIGILFLSIEDIGVQIEEPFAILPLEQHSVFLREEVGEMRKLVPQLRADVVGNAEAAARRRRGGSRRGGVSP